jgi:replicative superfamily II helicase
MSAAAAAEFISEEEMLLIYAAEMAAAADVISEEEIRMIQEAEIAHAKKQRICLFDSINDGAKRAFANAGIQKLWPWQVDCLSSEALAKGKNFLMSLPTSAGKSLIAEVMLLRCATQLRKKALLILPYVCLVVEKEDALEKLFEPSGGEIQSFYGSRGRIPLSPGPFVGVATIEKGNSIINSLIEESRVLELALVVIDEIHMLSEAGNGLYRGAILESIICKLKAFAPHVQIIGMSATIPNADQIATFMHAQYNSWQFRPVKLENQMQIRNALLNSECIQMKTLDSSDPQLLVQRVFCEFAQLQIPPFTVIRCYMHLFQKLAL